jgi:predicted RNase H-like HicB family nuclease
MNKIITFQISKGEDGYYIASADDVAIFTQGKTFEDLIHNIQEAVEVSFEGLIGKNTGRVFPPVMMNIDFSEVANA